MISILLVFGLASAQEIGAPPTPPAASGDAEESAPPAAAKSVSADAAQEEVRSILHALEAASFYQVGLELVTQRAFDEASAIFSQITERYSDTEYASAAKEQLDTLALLAEGVRPLETGRASRPARSGVTELAISQGLAMPVILGVLVPGATFQPEEPLVPVSLGMAGIGVGVGGAYLLNRVHPVEPELAMAIFSGEWIGALNGLAISAAWPPRGYRGLFAETLAGAVVGAGVGYAANLKLNPTPGGIAALNAGALWGTYFALMSEIFIYSETERELMLRTMTGLDLGALVGGALGWRYRPSRARVNLITLTGVAGTAIGGGVSILGVYYGSIYEEGAAAIVMSGTVLGLLSGAYLSRKQLPDEVAGVFLRERGFQVLPLVLSGPEDDQPVLGLGLRSTGW